MYLSSASVNQYCKEHSTSVIDILKFIERETFLRTTQPNMISGSILGMFYQEVVLMTRAKNILEIGTFTGYTTICLAEGLSQGGEVTTIEVNPESHWLANHFFDKYQHVDRINSILGDAMKVIHDLKKEWDLVLIDAGKKDNAAYYNKILPSVKCGGYIIVDNVIWKEKTIKGRVDKVTATINAFNKMIAKDNRVHKLMLPLRDGITLIRKL